MRHNLKGVGKERENQITRSALAAAIRTSVDTETSRIGCRQLVWRGCNIIVYVVSGRCTETMSYVLVLHYKESLFDNVRLRWLSFSSKTSVDLKLVTLNYLFGTIQTGYEVLLKAKRLYELYKSEVD